MILFMNDWISFPTAKVHTSTRNRSFIEYSRKLKAMGVKNNAWPLTLLQPELEFVDPYSALISAETQAKIIAECKHNPWYFFREIARFPGQGGAASIPFRANRGNMALFWCFFNHIDFALIMPRQFGKSASIDQLHNYTTNIAGVGQKIQLLTKDNKLRKENVDRLKAFRDLMPEYLQLVTRDDSDNKEEITCMKLGNKLLTGVAQKSEDAADNLGRGLTAAIQHYDELPYITNINISMPIALASSNRARAEAAKVGGFYGNIFSTTAGKKDTVDGAYAYKLIHNGMYWDEKLFDTKDVEEAKNIINKNSKGRRTIINGTFSHRQLGVSDEELKEMIINAEADEEIANRDFLNIWTSGSLSSPLTTKLNEVIKASEREHSYTEVTAEGYQLRWQYKAEEVKARMDDHWHVIGLDSSNAVGRDNCSFNILSTKDLGVVGAATVSETSILKYAKWISRLLIQYPKTILVIENKSTGQAILDIIVEELFAIGEDPFKRLYNRVVGNEVGGLAEIYKRIRRGDGRRDENLYKSYKGYFGFNTGGQGNSRSFLYGTTLKESAKSVGHICRDKHLIDEILALVKKDGRVDHPKGGHDDSVISWLIAQWFMRYGKDLGFYGLDGADIMCEVMEEGATMSQEQMQMNVERSRLREEINRIKTAIETSTDPIRRNSLELYLAKLAETTALDGGEVITMDSISKDLRINSRKSRSSRHGLNKLRQRRMAA